MAYQIHLVPTDGGPIGFDARQAVIERPQPARLSQVTVHTVTNPTTQEQSATIATPGDAEIWIGDLNAWISALRWRQGRVSVNAPRDVDDENSALRTLLRALADDLGAIIRGDEGEVYR